MAKPVPTAFDLKLDEGKRLMATTQADVVPAPRSPRRESSFDGASTAERSLLSKEYDPATFHSLFGDVGVRPRHLRPCSRGQQEPESSAATFAVCSVAPELAYIKAKFAALAHRSPAVASVACVPSAERPSWITVRVAWPVITVGTVALAGVIGLVVAGQEHG